MPQTPPAVVLEQLRVTMRRAHVAVDTATETCRRSRQTVAESRELRAHRVVEREPRRAPRAGGRTQM